MITHKDPFIFRFLFFRFLIVILALNACKKSDPLTPSPTENKIVSVELLPDKTSLVANEQDFVIFVVSAKGPNNQVVSAPDIDFYINGIKTKDAKFSTAVAGKYTVYAKWNEISSNIIELTAIDPADARKVTLTANTELIIADGKSTVQLSSAFTDEFGQSNQIANNEWTLYVNDEELSGKTFNTTTPGIYTLYAKSKGITSNQVEIVARENKIYPMVSIPVIFHIAHYGDVVDEGLNLNASRVHTVLENINQIFSNNGGSNNPNSVNMNIRFRLATIGMEGEILEEPGIIRYDITRFDDGYSASVSDKANDRVLGSNERAHLSLATSWDPTQYLNIWVTPLEDGSSWARMPIVYASHPLPGLGTVSDNCTDCIQNWVPFIFVHTYSFTGISPTPVHEVGHALGLRHVFSDNNCQTSDYCPDTYSYSNSSNLPCPDNLGLLERDNVMDYQITGISRNTFTYDQRERVRHVLNHGHWVSNLPHSTK